MQTQVSKINLSRCRHHFALAGRREYALVQDGHHYDTVVVWDQVDADEVARDNAPSSADEAGYEIETSTICETLAYCIRVGAGKRLEIDRRSLKCGSYVQTLDPPEPACRSFDEEGNDRDHEEHSWSTVPGSRWGSGAGVRYSERCQHCGLIRWTDTGATNGANGEQMTKVWYE